MKLLPKSSFSAVCEWALSAGRLTAGRLTRRRCIVPTKNARPTWCTRCFAEMPRSCHTTCLSTKHTIETPTALTKFVKTSGIRCHTLKYTLNYILWQFLEAVVILLYFIPYRFLGYVLSVSKIPRLPTRPRGVACHLDQTCQSGPSGNMYKSDTV